MRSLRLSPKKASWRSQAQKVPTFPALERKLTFLVLFLRFVLQCNFPLWLKRVGVGTSFRLNVWAEAVTILAQVIFHFGSSVSGF